jgi:para-nitrobenzyl esterase
VKTPNARLQTGISRRRFLANACLTACALRTGNLFALDVLSPPNAPISPNVLTSTDTLSSAVVRTPSGILRGDTAPGVRIFRGVPFAQPPIGALRFRPPVPIDPWTGERDATHFAPAAMQAGRLPVPQSEDCLYLNLWAPEGPGPFPVHVWIHGGGFVGGYPFEPTYDGAALAREGIVCITVAYRLGVFGFLDLEPLLGATYAGSGNNALRDLIAALAWIQQNVAAFGGDPTRVTIGGESAGAKLTGILMGTPSAQPLFHQMISESGGAERVWPTAQAAGNVAIGFGDLWRAQTGEDFSSLRTAPATSLIATQHRFMAHWPQHFPLRAEVDGTLLPRLPIHTIADGSTRGKRLLIGTNRDESALFIGPHPATHASPAELGNLTLAEFDKIYRHYKDIYPQMTDQQRLIRAISAEEYWIPSMRVVDAHCKDHGAAWMYRLDFAETSGWLRGYAYHSLDVGMVWDHPHTWAANAAAEAALAMQMHLAWAAFIRGETPAAPGLPAWPPYNRDTRSTMILNTQSHVEDQPQQAEFNLWHGAL